MAYCMKITFIYKISSTYLHDVVQKLAREFNLEGTAKMHGDEVVQILVCGDSEKIDTFIDRLHADLSKKGVALELEPFLKDRDFRGVFRVVE